MIFCLPLYVFHRKAAGSARTKGMCFIIVRQLLSRFLLFATSTIRLVGGEAQHIRYLEYLRLLQVEYFPACNTEKAETAGKRSLRKTGGTCRSALNQTRFGEVCSVE